MMDERILIRQSSTHLLDNYLTSGLQKPCNYKIYWWIQQPIASKPRLGRTWKAGCYSTRVKVIWPIMRYVKDACVWNKWRIERSIGRAIIDWEKIQERGKIIMSDETWKGAFWVYVDGVLHEQDAVQWMRMEIHRYCARWNFEKVTRSSYWLETRTRDEMNI